MSRGGGLGGVRLVFGGRSGCGPRASGWTFAVVPKNTLAGGRLGGWSCRRRHLLDAVYGVFAAIGLGAVGVQPLFEAVRWAGIAYLVFLHIEALRSAAAGRYLPFDREKTRRSVQ